MILLRHDCLVFKTMDGECIPCSSEEVTLEIIGDAIGLLDENVIKEASAGVLHYFKSELGNSKALNVGKGGPRTGRTVHKTGSQCMTGPANRGEPMQPKGEIFPGFGKR